MSGPAVLLLVPTDAERRELEALGGFEPELAAVELCGFGPIAAAARCAALLARARPGRAVLVGIAGSYDPRALPIGAAEVFGRVEIDGLETAGFTQWDGIGTGLDLEAGESARGRLLVTVTTPSGTTAQAAERAARHPGARAEDMEGFGVALACALERVPLAIVRGISNAAGDREKGRWKVRDALAAARERALELLANPERSPLR